MANVRYRTADINGIKRSVCLAWRKQEPDSRDFLAQNKLVLSTAPPSVDLRPGLSPVEDQGALGSCTANALAAMVEANELKRAVNKGLFFQLPEVAPKVTVSGAKTAADGSITFSVKVVPAPAPAPTPPPPAPKAFIDVSRLFQYYATRKIEGTTSEDSGATIRDTLKAAATYGVVDEKLWPYDTSKYAQNPPADVWATAAKYKVTNYLSIKNGDLATMKSVLAQGYIIEFGFTVYSSFMSADMAAKGLLCRPTKSEFIEGGHAVCLVGYDDAKVMPDGSVGAFLVRNSWGTGWGLNGYFWMAYNYVSDTSLCSDFWVIEASPI